MNTQKNDLDPLFKPKSMAVVGVPRDGYRFGGLSFLKKLQTAGFPGALYPINPKATEILGMKAYPDLPSLPEVPDLAMVSVGAGRVPDVLQSCGEIGLKHIHILTSGFNEIGTNEGRELDDRIRTISEEYGLMVVGPNCMGPYCPSSHLTAWGAIPGKNGTLGIISQSGGITQRLTEYTCSVNIGVAKAVSFGNGTVLGDIDFLQYMGEDDNVGVIAMYLESVRDGNAFLRAAGEVNLKKPVILWKGGESEAGARTAASHTGALAGGRGAWEAFFRQTGVTRVSSMNEWVDAITAFTWLAPPSGIGVFLIGGGGGNSVSYSDTCVREGLSVPQLSEDTMAVLRGSVPSAGSIAGNPLDHFRIFQDAHYLAELLDLAYKDPAIAMIVVDRLIPRMAFHLPDAPDSNPAVIQFLKGRKDGKPTVFTVDSEGGDPVLIQQGAELRARFREQEIPAFPSLDRAARALRHLVAYGRRLRLRIED
ncbi:MAG: CoA-binding protein [Deltaproteobacteria bacterium]|nr:CoA-binding protein [Deltaproteobacteria bacterium]